jgi:hypothetical protein
MIGIDYPDQRDSYCTNCGPFLTEFENAMTAETHFLCEVCDFPPAT